MKNTDSKGEKMVTKNLIMETIHDLEELAVYNDQNVKNEAKKQQISELLIDLKKFLLDKKADLARKHAIILRMPLLQLTVRKA